MPEIQIDPSEISENTRIIAYDQWHPKEGQALWKRLEVPGQYRNGMYANPAAFDLKELPDGRGYSREISQHERLLYWNSRLAAAFAVEHYLADSRLGAPSPKILEIGAWPEKNATVETQYDNTLTGVLSGNPTLTVAAVDNIDVSRVFPYQSYTPPNFGKGVFINGDFFDAQVQQQIIKVLGGKPHVIAGNMVFERRLGNSYHKYADRQFQPLWTPDSANSKDKPEAGEAISRGANEFLRSDGVLVICNYGSGKLPDFVHRMPLEAVYLDKSGTKPFVQVRKKI